MNTPPHKSDFIRVNGIKLHYLDWGGEGETLLFLTGMGNSAHCFDRIAPRFADKFRVLALTRRGQAESDCPESGYDLETLVDDILAFMNALEVEKNILAGNSLAGVEMSCFTEKYPERVTGLVYLDAVYDPKARKEILQNSPIQTIQPPDEKTEFDTVDDYVEYLKYIRPDLAEIWADIHDQTVIYDLEKNAQGKFVEKDTSAIERQILGSATEYDPRHANIKVPVLGLFAISTPIRPSYFSEEQKRLANDFHREQYQPYQQWEIAQFRKYIPQARVIEIPGGHHACYIAEEDLVYAEMCKFLLE